MDATDKYFTIASASEGIFKEKGSKFIAYAYCVSTEEDIKDRVQTLRKEYYDARHHCFGYQLGLDGTKYRANDDGEPSGTAGKPILGQIRSQNLTNVLIVVVRYFGGTKLGTSGLITAYREAAMEALNNATIVEKTVDDVFSVGFDYGVMNDVMRVIKEEAPDVIKQDFNLRCEMELSTRKGKVDALVGRLKKIESVSIDYLRTT